MFLLAWFVYFNWDALLVHFAPDDPMNLNHYWHIRFRQLLFLQFMPWRGPYRPMGGLFYRGMLHFFGLNPVPYHAAVLLVLLAIVYLVYRLARALGCGELAAGLAALGACYQAGLSNLYYDTAFVFDVLACFFYLAAFVYYARIRGTGRPLKAREIVVHLGLYLCALNSKEMAATMPAVLLAYEWFYHKLPRGPKALAVWLFGPGRTILLGAVLDCGFLYGTMLRPGALVIQPGYQPAFSLARFMDFYSQAFSDLFETRGDLGWAGAVLVWVVISYLAWRCDRPVLRFCWACLVITPMPLAVLAGRRGACLAIPFAFMTVFAAVVFLDLARAGACFLATERAFRRYAPRHLFAAICVVGMASWGLQNDFAKTSDVKRSMNELGQTTSQAIDQLRKLHPHVEPGSSVVFLNDPFEGWDMAFIAEVWFNDHSLDIKLARKTPFTSAELSRVNHLFTFENGTLRQLK